jgi:hypothetical protein
MPYSGSSYEPNRPRGASGHDTAEACGVERREIGQQAEIGPKTPSFGPISAENGGNQPKSRLSGLAAAAANTLQTSRIQG